MNIQSNYDSVSMRGKNWNSFTDRIMHKIIAGTGVGMFVVRGPIYKAIVNMTNVNGKSRLSKALLPKSHLLEITKNEKFLKNYRSALSMSIALLAMSVTNFVLDAPLTVCLTNMFNDKTLVKKDKGAEQNKGMNAENGINKVKEGKV